MAPVPAPSCPTIRVFGLTLSGGGPQCRRVSAKGDTTPPLPPKSDPSPKLNYDLQLPRAGVRSSGARYDFLPPNEASSTYVDMQSRLRTSQLPRGCAVGGRVTGLAPTADEIAAVRRAIDALGPLKRCDNHPLQHFALLDELADSSCNVGSTAGQWFTGGGDTIFLRRTTPAALEQYALHELAHALMHSHDPRTCATYNNPQTNPLLIEWKQRMGWSEDGTVLTKVRGNRAPTAYAGTSAAEDMAESFAIYMSRPESLREVSPARHAFFDSLFAALRETKTPAAGDEPVTLDTIVEP